MDELLMRLIDSYHDVANELSDILATWNGGNGLPLEIERAVAKIRDSMDSLYNETIPHIQRAADSASPEQK